MLEALPRDDRKGLGLGLGLAGVGLGLGLSLGLAGCRHCCLHCLTDNLFRGLASSAQVVALLTWPRTAASPPP